MKMFWNLKRMDYYIAACSIKDAIPELKKVDVDHICDHLRGTDMEFYYSEKKKTPFYIRLTMPFAIIAAVLMLLFMPVKYIITGTWGYQWQWLINWFRAVGF